MTQGARIWLEFVIGFFTTASTALGALKVATGAVAPDWWSIIIALSGSIGAGLLKVQAYLTTPAKLVVLLVLGAALTGCATIPADPSKMTAEQLREAVKDKAATLGCATVQTPYKGNTVFLNLDQGVLKVGEVTVDAECKVTIKNKQ